MLKYLINSTYRLYLTEVGSVVHEESKKLWHVLKQERDQLAYLEQWDTTAPNCLSQMQFLMHLWREHLCKPYF